MKLTESLQVNYQRLSEINGKNPKKEKVGLDSSDLMQVRKMIKAETIFSQKHLASPMEKRKNMRCRYLHLLIPDWGKLAKQSSIFKNN
jgi:hypothetical protein